MAHKLRGISFLALFILPALSFANDDVPPFNDHHYSLGVDFGLSGALNLNNSTEFPLGYSTFIYNAKPSDINPILYGLSFSRNINLTSLYTLQVGFTYNYTTNLTATGDLAQGISPPYYQSTYTYHVNSSQLLAEAKIIRQFLKYFYPYFSLGIGGAINTAKNYSTDIPDYLTLTPYYVNKTTQSFTYAVGLGVEYFIKPRVSLGLGYRFSDLGAAGLGSGTLRSMQIPAKLYKSNLYMNTFLIQLNYLF